MELLHSLYKIHSMSGQEKAMRKFIKRYVRDNIAGAVCRQDHGNIYIVKGESDTYPCVVAHLDQVQHKHSKDFTVIELAGRLFGFSGGSARQEGLGADDKNGIWVALKCLEHFDAIKVALFWGEETGCQGSSKADMQFFTDCRFAIQADRRNGGDLITDICGSICSDEFKNDIADIAERHGYKQTHGMMTDVDTLSDNGLGVSAINMSCGYYNPHTDEEYTDIAELYNCLEFAKEIISECTKVYPFKRKKMKWNYGGYGGYGGYNYYGGYSGNHKRYDDYEDWDEDERWDNQYGTLRVVSKNDEKKERKGDWCDGDIWVPDFNDFYNPEDAVEQFLMRNFGKKSEDELWDYIAADCETYGLDYDFYLQYCDFVHDYLGELNEDEKSALVS